MKQEDDDASANCPFLAPHVSAHTALNSLAVYCRSPNGRVRVPARDELVSLCTDGQHGDCPGYRRWKGRGGIVRVTP